MKANMWRIKKELKTIDEKNYYENLTVETLKDMFEKCKKHYAGIETFYSDVSDKSDAKVTFKPLLAEYMYHIALRF